MWRWKSDWGWCLGGAYFLAKFQAGGAYRGGAYKKKSVYLVPDSDVAIWGFVGRLSFGLWKSTYSGGSMA